MSQWTAGCRKCRLDRDPPRRLVRSPAVVRFTVLFVCLLWASPAVAHWSLKPRTVPAIPAFSNSADRAWLRTSIDPFILKRLHAAELRPAPEADRATLIRRLAF